MPGSRRSINGITTTELALNTRFAYKEKYVSGDFSRVSMGTPYPVAGGPSGARFQGRIRNGDYDYTKLILAVCSNGSPWVRWVSCATRSPGARSGARCPIRC